MVANAADVQVKRPIVRNEVTAKNPVCFSRPPNRIKIVKITPQFCCGQHYEPINTLNRTKPKNQIGYSYFP
jgi:hypothetical protein